MPAEKMRVIELCDARRAKLKAMMKAKERGEPLDRFKKKPSPISENKSLADEASPQSSLGNF